MRCQLDTVMPITKIISFVEIKTETPENELESFDKIKKNTIKDSVNKKIPRNAICPLCDSGKKYKRCCGKL